MNKAILYLCILIMSVSSITGQPNNQEYQNTPTLNVCDHNQDGVVNLVDVSIFARCKDSFDANEDQTHNLIDVALYAQNFDDSAWCAEHLSECVEDDVTDVPEFGTITAALVLVGIGLIIYKRREN